jgi:hypothetical protein
MTTFKKALLSFTVACGVAVSAHAAEITECKDCFPDHRMRAIEVKGEIVAGDAAKFKALINSMPRDKQIVVGFESSGGLLIEGLQIGDAIHDAGAQTMASFCDSTCAMAWLAGSTRYIADQGRVGFHAPILGAPGEAKNVSGPGAAIMGYYIARLGLAGNVALWATEKGSDDLNILTPENAKELGIPTQFLKG